MITIVAKLLLGTFFVAGIALGSFSYSYSCAAHYMDFRKPTTYIMFPVTIGFYVGRVISYPYGSDKSHSSCSNIFNYTLEGPKK